MYTSYFGRVEGRGRQMVLRTSADLIFWNEDSSEYLRSFAGFIQICSNNTLTSLQISALFAYPMHAVLLKFKTEHKTRLARTRQSLVAFLPVDTEINEVMRDTDIGGLENQYMSIPCPRYWMLKKQCL